jgi:hypothetical protein
MILPTKHIKPDRALLGIGSELLPLISRGKTVSALWDDLRTTRQKYAPHTPLSYDWFILALDLLFVIGVVQYERGIVRRVL